MKTRFFSGLASVIGVMCIVAVHAAHSSPPAIAPVTPGDLPSQGYLVVTPSEGAPVTIFLK